MKNEDPLHVAAGRGSKALALLNDPLIAEAFAGLEAAYTKAWRSTTIDNITGREKLFLAINIVGKVKDHLASIIANGRVAEHELREIAEAAERKKGWHEIR